MKRGRTLTNYREDRPKGRRCGGRKNILQRIIHIVGCTGVVMQRQNPIPETSEAIFTIIIEDKITHFPDEILIRDFGTVLLTSANIQLQFRTHQNLKQNSLLLMFSQQCLL
jgi:hypothetical protein